MKPEEPFCFYLKTDSAVKLVVIINAGLEHALAYAA